MNRAIKGVIFDIDGVLEFQGSVSAGAPEVVRTLRERGYILRFLTNSTLKSRESCTMKLNEKGFDILPKEVITASFATAHYLKSLEPKSCWVLLDGEGMDEFKDFKQDLMSPEYIVIGDYRSNFNFQNLNKVLRLLLTDSKLIGMIEELVDSSLGEIELNVGSWVQMLEKASGKKATFIGKPSPYVFDLALKDMNLDKSDVIMVGNQVSTDIKGAINFGIKSILLKTGEFKEKDLTENLKPDYILNSIKDILLILQ